VSNTILSRSRRYLISELYSTCNSSSIGFLNKFCKNNINFAYRYFDRSHSILYAKQRELNMLQKLDILSDQKCVINIDSCYQWVYPAVACSTSVGCIQLRTLPCSWWWWWLMIGSSLRFFIAELRICSVSCSPNIVFSSDDDETGDWIELPTATK